MSKDKIVNGISPYTGYMADIDQFVIYRGDLYNIKELLIERFLIKDALSDLTSELTKLKEMASGLEDENLHLSKTLETLTAKADKIEKKHISDKKGLALLFEKPPADPAPEIEPAPAPETDKCRCPKCKNDRLMKWGFKKVKGEKKQQFRCTNCKYIFVPGIIRNGRRKKQFKALEVYKIPAPATA